MTTPPTTITVRAPHDLIAASAVVLGFWPTESIVLLTFAGAEQFHARVDLPDDPVDLPAVTQLLLAPVLQHRVERVAVLVFCDDERRVALVWRSLRDAFAARGVVIVDALRADGRRWYPLAGGDRRLREIGVAYDLEAHPFLAQAVFSGRITRRSRDDLAASLDSDPAGVLEVERAATALAARRPCFDAVEASLGEVLAEGEWVRSLVRRHVAAGSVCSDAETARLLWGMQQPRVRDAAWSTLRRDRARESVEFWTDIVRRTPNWLLVAPATLLGWSAWQSGNGALAWCALDRALDVDSEYGLATLLSGALTRAVPPSAWDDLCVEAWSEGLDVG
ncbi:MAG: DUF4192 domain-containing protein [Nocardioides sp.]